FAADAQLPWRVDAGAGHGTPFAPPRDRAEQPREQRVGTGDPARPYVEPCSRRERGAPDGGAERSGRDLVADIQQGRLEGNAHIDRVARVVKHVFDPRVILGRYWQTVGVTYPRLPGDAAILSLWRHPDD